MFPTFDIFFGHFKQDDVIWIEAREGIVEAYEKMLQMAAEKPGPYFVFSSYAQTCVASIDTSSFVESDDRSA